MFLIKGENPVHLHIIIQPSFGQNQLGHGARAHEEENESGKEFGEQVYQETIVDRKAGMAQAIDQQKAWIQGHLLLLKAKRV